MNDIRPTGNPLDLAASQLREICEQSDRFAPPLDTASLGRMITHIRNINRAVAESPEDHANAAKRLTDFSLVLGRIARNAPPVSEDLAGRMKSVAETLKNTSAQLAGTSEPTRWANGPR
jgi:hypothetical protein